LLHAFVTTLKLFFILVAQKKELRCKLASQLFFQKRNAMQRELVIHEKHRRRIFFFLVTMQRKDFFSFFMCIFYNANLFFLAMHICYDANLLHVRRKRSTLLLFCYNTKKTSFLLIACFLAFFWLQYFIFLWHAITLLHGIRRRNTYMLLFLATTYPILLLFLYFSSTPLSFWLQCFLMHP